MPEKRAALLLENCIGIARNVARAYVTGQLERAESLRIVLDQTGTLIRHEVARGRRSDKTEPPIIGEGRSQ